MLGADVELAALHDGVISWEAPIWGFARRHMVSPVEFSGASFLGAFFSAQRHCLAFFPSRDAQKLDLAAPHSENANRAENSAFLKQMRTSSKPDLYQTQGQSKEGLAEARRERRS